MAINFHKGYIFVIDTDTYSGNFERELTAWCTGQIGECGRGAKEAENFNTLYPHLIDYMDNNITHVPDKNRCHRPTSIWTTPGYWNDGLGNHWPEEKWGSQEAIELYKKSCKKHGSLFKGMNKHPAYQSVAIFFYEKPEQKIIDMMILRAKSYCTKYLKENLNIKSFRIIKTKIVEESIWTHNV